MLPELKARILLEDEGFGLSLQTNLHAYGIFLRLVFIRLIAQSIDVSKDDLIAFLKSSISDDIVSNLIAIDMNQLFNQMKGDEE